MNKKEIKKWLDEKVNEEDEVMILAEVDNGSLRDPNMGYATIEEVFAWQDQLDSIEYSNEGLTELYLLTEDVLDTLESRFELSPEFVRSLENVENGDFVKVNLPERSFFDLINDYCDATKIGDVLTSCSLLIHYVKNHISDVECDIYDGQLFIKPIDNTSLSTSIISELLGIKASNIDDKEAFKNLWSIHLTKR